MTVFIIRRLMQSSVVVAVMSLLVFVGVNIVGDPVDMLINPEADQAEIERVMRDLGLDRPVHEQYGYFVVNALQGDLGKSFIFGEPALQLIVQRMPATFELAIAALLDRRRSRHSARRCRRDSGRRPRRPRRSWRARSSASACPASGSAS